MQFMIAYRSTTLNLEKAMRSAIAKLFVFIILALNASTSAAQSSGKKIFYWTVVNNNRLFATDDPTTFDPSKPDKQTQYRFLKNLCTARYCAALYPKKVGIAAYCGTSMKIECSESRSKKTDSQSGLIRSWGVLPQKLATNWNEKMDATNRST